MEFPHKIKHRTTTQFSNPTSGYLSKENKITNSKRYMNPMFIAILFTIAKIQKQPKCPLIEEWIKKV